MIIKNSKNLLSWSKNPCYSLMILSKMIYNPKNKLISFRIHHKTPFLILAKKAPNVNQEYILNAVEVLFLTAKPKFTKDY